MISDDNKQDNIKTQFQIFMEIVNDLVVVINQNKDFVIELINQCPLLDKLEYSENDLTGKPFLTIFFSEDVKKIAKFFKKGVETFSHFQEIRLLSKKGEIIWAEIKAKKFTEDFSYSKRYFKTEENRSKPKGYRRSV